MKVKVLLGTATIALVSFVGAVYAVVGQDMPNVPQASVATIVEAVEQPQVEVAEEVLESVVKHKEVVAQDVVVQPEEEVSTTPDRWKPFANLIGYSEESMRCIDNYVSNYYRGGYPLEDIQYLIYRTPVHAMVEGAALSSMSICEYVEHYIATRHNQRVM